MIRKLQISVLSMMLAIIVSGIFSIGYVKNLNAENLDTETQYVMPKVNLTNYDLNTINITMSRGQCFGTCPVYYLEIDGNGKVTYRGFFYVNVTEERTAHISPQKVKELITAFDNADYFNLRDKYDEIRFTDLSTVETSISINGIYKSVYDYYGTVEVPELKKLRNLEKLIDNVTNSAQWVGNLSLSSKMKVP
jgi:hypothetical protein